MRAWISEASIAIEGAPDEWHLFLLRLLAAYNETQTIDLVWHDFLKGMKEKQERSMPATSSRHPDLEWYERNQK